MSLLEIEKLINEDKYLFHVTDEVGYRGILRLGLVLPLTKDYTREMFGLVKKGTEKGTASFTSNPICLIEESPVAFDEDKWLIMVFDRQKLVEQGVAPAIYVSEEEFRKRFKDYMVAVEEAEGEYEWRSIDIVSIGEAYLNTLELCRVDLGKGGL